VTFIFSVVGLKPNAWLEIRIYFSHFFSPMENKQDRKLASLKKDPDEDVGSNHDRKPASLKKDPYEDVVILNNHYDSTDMEEEDDYDELDEIPLLEHFCMAEQYLREKNYSPQKRLEELQKKDIGFSFSVGCWSWAGRVQKGCTKLLVLVLLKAMGSQGIK
jgi:hypothetical protein